MNNKYYPKLFSPLIIKNKVIKNRIVSAPHSCPYMLVPGENGFFNYSEDACMYYANIARGGAGIVNTGHLGVDPRYYLGGNKMYFNFFSPLLRWHQIPNMRRMTTMIHAYDAIASIELNHGGHYSTPLVGNEVPGPSTCMLENGRNVRGIDEAEMNLIADYFADAAEIGVQGGFDMINVHAAHNWLLGQFFSPIDNKRTDQYGGSVINRARFPKMVLQRIRERVGEDILIEIRFSASELCENGYGIQEAIETIKYLQDTIDIVQCSAGRLGNMETEAFTFPNQYMENGCNTYLAKAMKSQVNIPVETIGGIDEPYMAESIISDGTADLVGMARAFIADPNWAAKAKVGKPEDIRPCIRCIRCMDSNEATGVGVCSVNPRRVLYHEMPCELKKDKKRIAVIGGGPAGLEAAIDLCKVGHTVSLYEKSNSLGGKLSFSDHIVFKEDIKRYRDYLITQAQKEPNLDIKYNTNATPKLLNKENYDAVVVAIGADCIIPDIQGIHSPNVYKVTDIFGNEAILGDSVAIIGGGQIGCETAIHLASLGKKITIIEMQDEIMKDAVDLPDETFSTKFYLKHEFNKKNTSFIGLKNNDKIDIRTSTLCTYVLPGLIKISCNSTVEDIPVDSVIIATGFRPDNITKLLFENIESDVTFIGDCDKVGNISTASASGYYTSLKL